MTEVPRQSLILEFLRAAPYASVQELQERLGVSAATVRRAIDRLHREGKARKVPGGVSVHEAGAASFRAARPFHENRDIGVPAKRAIADRAAMLVRDGDTIVVHGGSTCYELGLKLAHRPLRIHTNSMPLAAALAQTGVCQLSLAGGTLHREPGILHDPASGPPRLFASRFFLGAQGLGEDGVLESHPLLVKSIGELADCTDEVVVLAESRKFAIRPRLRALPLSRVSTLVTDDAISDADAKTVEREGVTILTVPVAGDAASSNAEARRA